MRISKTYILVCNSLKPKQQGQGCCGEKACNELFMALETEISTQNSTETMEVIFSSCLNQCETGMNVKVIPGNILYGHLQQSDVAELVMAIKEGKVVERLRIKPQPRFWEL